MAAPIPAPVLAAILFAALLHAGWNAVLKAQDDSFCAAVAVTAGAGVLGALALPFLAGPAMASWPFIAASALLQTVYYLLLSAIYRDADISHAYPLMRGSAPVLVALANGALGAEQLGAAQWAAIGLICAGGATLYLGSRAGKSGAGRMTALALLTAVVIAAYTLVDGLGVRRSGAPAAYTAWIFLLTGIAITLMAWRRLGAPLASYIIRKPGLALAGGAATTGSYGIALWAMTHAPVAVVAALRETSIVFATAIAVLLLGERLTRARILGAALIGCGAVAIRLA
ncbi:EamA family transporter [Massilia niastensis]|uniref:EamA family transporter n=1 Tax=Massilia niastensis TaxID=544911 RepID=UPI000374C76E|nr:EamA family transporter [Massilia niastensis]